MSWLNSREKKENEKLNSEKAIKEKQESLHKLRSPLVNELAQIIDSLKIQSLFEKVFQHSKHLFTNSINSKKIIELSLVDENKLSKLFIESESDNKEKIDFDLVESFYFLFSLLDFSESYVFVPIHNQYNKTIMVRRSNFHLHQLNSNILDIINKGGFYERSKNLPLLGGSVKKWASKSDDVSKMKSTLEEFKNDKLIKYYLWMRSDQSLNKQNSDLTSLDIKGNPAYFDEIEKKDSERKERL